MEVLSYCLCYIIGAGSVIFAYKTFSNRVGTTIPNEEENALNLKIDSEDAIAEQKIIEQWQELLDYDPYRTKEPQPEGGEMNEHE